MALNESIAYTGSEQSLPIGLRTHRLRRLAAIAERVVLLLSCTSKKNSPEQLAAAGPQPRGLLSAMGTVML